MNVVSSKKMQDGATVETRYTLYLSSFEFSCLLDLFKEAVVPSPTEISDQLKPGPFPEVVRKRLQLMLDELVKIL